MPNLKSAKKRVLVSERNRVRNLAARRSVQRAVRSVEKALEKKEAGTPDLLKTAVQTIDRAYVRGIFHRNTAARYKSRLSLKVNKALNAAAV